MDLQIPDFELILYQGDFHSTKREIRLNQFLSHQKAHRDLTRSGR
jgi:hypothetical protein